MKALSPLFLVVFLFLMGCFSSKSSSPSPAPEVLNEKNQEQTPERKETPASLETLKLNGAQVKKITLSNGLQALLVSSPTSRKASAAMAVGVGSLSDPTEAQGLAHYLEHMLFLGTDEYPVVGEYQDFLQTYGGASNAYTSATITNYYFEISPVGYSEALSRFSSFFTSPRLDRDFADREKNAVHEEFNFRKDRFTPLRVLHAFVKEDKGRWRFRIGNKESLENVTVEQTRAFYDEFYFAENMALVLSGPSSLDELEKFAKTEFSDIESRPSEKGPKYNELFELDMDLLPASVHMDLKSPEKTAQIVFPVVSPKKENPRLLALLGGIIGDEGGTP